MYNLFSPDKWRFERKFFVEVLSKYEIESLVKLHPALFSEIYYQRDVNNIYFDTVNLSNYMDNEVGNSERLKVRIRWYGDLFQTVEKPVLEIKIKNGFLGSKISYLLDPITISQELTADSIHQIFRNSSTIPELLKQQLVSLNFTLLNSYKRKYYQSADKRFRITIDSDLSFYQINQNFNLFFNNKPNYNNTIMELKYDEKNDDYAEAISNYFPYRVTKSSKYVSGLQKLYS